MTLRIRQIVLATHDLAATVARCERELGLQVAYRDPGVGEFGLHNALLPIGDQFLEVLAPTRDGTAAGRHLARHGESAYMLILQTDELERDRARLERLGVRIVWRSDYADICSVHLHPKDIGAAIVSLDQATPPESWRWAGPEWQLRVSPHGAREIRSVTIGAIDPEAMAQRWAEVLGTAAPRDGSIAIDRGTLSFTRAQADVITGFGLAAPAGPNAPRSTSMCGTRFDISTTT
jgi:catechol 2,3-dioxygenase-like lactoylglutathione lyase family enzyme